MLVRIAHITDLHLDEAFPIKHGVRTRERFEKILNDIKKENINEIVCTGDICKIESLPYFFELIKPFSLSITLGNHDWFAEVGKYYTIGTHNSSQKIYWSDTKGEHKVIYLDSSEGRIDGKQMFWLKKELVTPKPIIIFIHHPILALKMKVDEIGCLKNRGKLITLLESLPNSISIFCGHYHMEYKTTYKNITQNITPAISFQIEKNLKTIEINTNKYGYRIIEIKENMISSKTKIFAVAK